MTTTFNDTSTLQGLAQHIRFITGQDALSIEHITRLTNFALDDYSDLQMTSSGRWKGDDSTNTTLSSYTTTLEAEKRDYVLETTFSMLDRVSVLDTSGNWKVLEPVDRRDNKTTALSTIYGTSGEPTHYDLDGNVLSLYPTPATTRSAGVRAHITRPVNYFSTTDTTATIGIPRQHHEYLALHASHRVTFRTKDSNRVQIRDELLVFEEKIKKFYTMRDQDRPRRLVPKNIAPSRSFIRRGRGGTPGRI